MTLPNENDLLAELDRLEKSTLVRKGGDALQSASHDGGLATEGTNIQSKAIKKAIKAMVKGGMSKSDAEATAKKAFGNDSDSDSESEDTTAKGMDDDSESDDEAGSDDAESPDDDEGEGAGDGGDKMPMSKSLGAAQLANASNNRTLRKALTDEHPETIDAAPILGQLIDAFDRLASSSGGMSKKDHSTLRKSIAQVQTNQNAFNGKLAKALSMIAERVIATETIVKAMANEPVTSQRQPTLRKSDLAQPAFHGNDTRQIEGRMEPSPLANVEYLKIQEALVEICMKGGGDIMDITKFENSHGDLSKLPANVVKQLEQRLCAATA